MKKKLGIGSLSLLLAVVGVIWSMNFPVHYDTFCIGDYVLNHLGLPPGLMEPSAPITRYSGVCSYICLDFFLDGNMDIICLPGPENGSPAALADV